MMNEEFHIEIKARQRAYQAAFKGAVDALMLRDPAKVRAWVENEWPRYVTKEEQEAIERSQARRVA